MKTNNSTEFSVDKENLTIKVVREFKAPVWEVWAAWKERELLDKWWAPKSWKSRTRSMVFKEGEMRHYAMVGPNGDEHWSFASFKSIIPEAEFTFHNGFCDKEGNINKELPQSVWDVDFMGQDFSTIVTVLFNIKAFQIRKKSLKWALRKGLQWHSASWTNCCHCKLHYDHSTSPIPER